MYQGVGLSVTHMLASTAGLYGTIKRISYLLTVDRQGCCTPYKAEYAKSMNT